MIFIVLDVLVELVSEASIVKHWMVPNQELLGMEILACSFSNGIVFSLLKLVVYSLFLSQGPVELGKFQS